MKEEKQTGREKLSNEKRKEEEREKIHSVLPLDSQLSVPSFSKKTLNTAKISQFDF